MSGGFLAVKVCQKRFADRHHSCVSSASQRLVNFPVELSTCGKDHHHEHRATLFFVNKALDNLLDAGRLPRRPKVYGMLTHTEEGDWPPDGDSYDCPELARVAHFGEPILFPLTPDEHRQKLDACMAFARTLGESYIKKHVKKEELF